MEDVKNYSIALEGVPDSERIIFKLICSVSARTKGRSKHYQLNTDNNSVNADLLISTNSTSQSNRDKNNPAYYIELANQSSELGANTLGRPLIATRVLSTLDDFVDKYLVELNKSKAEPEETVYSDFKFSEDDKIEDEDEIDTISLELTEEEASELAIVHDETLTNPANLENEYLQDLEPSQAQVTPISLARSELVAEEEGYPNFETPLDTLNFEHRKSDAPRALVVDDSPSVRKQLEIELEQFNVNVDYAATAQEAMDYLDADDYDVAFLDVVLPDKDGFTICRHIKESSRDTTVIMLTGKAKQADKVKGALAGCDSYMVKPVGRMTFQATVKNYLSLVESASAVEA